MGLFKSIFLRLKNEKVITTKHPGDILGYKDFSLKKITSLKIIGPICKKDLDRIVSVIKDRNEISHIDLKDTTELLEISNNQFHGCDCLESIILPKGIKRVGESAFEYCRNLTSIEMPDGLQTISKSAFYGCSSLRSIEIPAGVKTIGNWALGCINLEEIKVNSQNTYFKSFDGILYTVNQDTLIKFPCKKDVLDYTIPSGTKKIASGAFQDCTALCIINLPNTLLEIGDNAFINTSIKSIKIPKGVLSVGKMAFSQCNYLERVEIPGTITHLGERAFTECNKLTDVIVEDGITGIGDNVFANCHSLTRVDLPASAYIVKE